MMSARLGASHRHPARYASVCSRWNDLLADSSEVWKECVLTCTRKPALPPMHQVEGPEETAAMLAWLVRRCMSMESVTFRNFKVRTWVDGRVHHQACTSLPCLATSTGEWQNLTADLVLSIADARS